MKRYLLFSFFMFCLSGVSRAGVSLDSLEKIAAGNRQDTAMANTLNALGQEYYRSGDERGEAIYRRALKMAMDLGYIPAQIQSCKGLGNILSNQGQYQEAIEFYTKGIQQAAMIHDSLQYSTIMNNLGLIYFDKGDYSRAMDYYLKVLAIAERHEYTSVLGLCTGNISLVYFRQKNYTRAMEYGHRSVAYRLKTNNPLVLPNAYNNLGIIYEETGEWEKAIQEYRRALAIARQIGSETKSGAYMDNLANVFLKMKELDSANHYNQKAYELRLKYGDSLGVANSLINRAAIFIEQKRLKEAEVELQKSLVLCKSVGLLMQERECYNSLAGLYSLTGRYQLANEMLLKYMVLNDSIQGTEVSTRIAQMESVMELEKKENENILLKNEASLKDAQIAQERTFRYFLFGVVGLALVLIGLGWMAYRNKREHNRILSDKNVLIEGQKKEITDSINYARRIQAAILPEEKELKKVFPECFIMYQPKDIVSGDFYFWESSADGFYLACADCTGHGVPGALMSMVGKEKLAAAIGQSNQTGEILSRLNRLVKTTLRQDAGEDSSRDGMDIALLRWENGNLQYSGANRPLWYCRNGIITEVKPTKAAIGGFTADDQPFETHTLTPEKGDMIYLFTDGYADQFGGKDSKKFTTKQFRELLLRFSDLPADEQKKCLQNTFSEWKRNLEQIDDVLVIGLKI
ncbi:MAG: tetratricopeptide repeat protein [Bacteroidia bacterium]|nr:tetratricopeptide repeat protein [Bacteroidia bacterium]